MPERESPQEESSNAVRLRGKWLRRTWLCLAWGGLAVVSLLAAAMHLMEPTGGLVFAWYYAPKAWVAVGLFLLALPGWIGGRRLGAVLFLSGILWAGLGLGWQWNGLRGDGAVTKSGSAAAPVLRVLTCNRGESGGHDFFPFVRRIDPDVMVMQQGRSQGAWRPDAAELAARPHGMQVGEFIVRSRFPIVSQQLLVAGVVTSKSGPRRVEPGLRCVVDAGALGQVVVYNVHLPSPRFALREMGLGATQAVPSAQVLVNGGAESQRYWEMHVECARLVRESIRSETLPVVAMGDWNNPDHGPLYREFTRGLRDAHREAGRGYGWTFPDDVSSWLAGGRPWLRLDYVLTSLDWRVVECEVEADAEQAQHRAVAARLVLGK